MTAVHIDEGFRARPRVFGLILACLRGNIELKNTRDKENSGLGW